MKQIPKNHGIKFLAFVLALTLASAFVVPAKADDVDSLKKSTGNLENELSTLNKDLKKLNSDINAITKQIEEMNERIEETQTELSLAKGEEQVQYENMKTRIRFMYEKGNRSLLESLFSSASLADFIRRADYFIAINTYDRNSLEKLSDTKEEIQEKEAALAEEKETLNAILNDLDEKEVALQSEISSTSSELNKYQTKLDKAQKAAQKTENNLNEEVPPTIPPEGNSSPSHSNPQGNYVASASEIELFAALIECEAGSTHYEGMLAVASVVVNRMNHSAYPNTLRGVILARGQFPPATNGKVDKVLQRGIKASCLQVAKDALAGKNNVGSCLSFRAASSGHPGTVIGSNVFF